MDLRRKRRIPNCGQRMDRGMPGFEKDRHRGTGSDVAARDRKIVRPPCNMQLELSRATNRQQLSRLPRQDILLSPAAQLNCTLCVVR